MTCIARHRNRDLRFLGIRVAECDVAAQNAGGLPRYRVLGADILGAFLYRAPRSFRFRWTLDGLVIAPGEVPLGPFDLDDIGAEIGQMAGGEWAGNGCLQT